MDIEFVREYCLSFPGATEKVQWGDNLLFNIGEKIFLLYNFGLETENRITLKCSPENFHEMTERERIIPAPYYGKSSWICIQDGCRIRTSELKDLIKGSYDIVYSKLPVKIRQEAGKKRRHKKKKQEPYC